MDSVVVIIAWMLFVDNTIVVMIFNIVIVVVNIVEFNVAAAGEFQRCCT